MKQDASRVINGTYGTVWVDGELWAEVDSFTARINPEYDDVNFANDSATYRKGIGWASEGTMTIKKIYSRMQRKLAQGIKNGIYPRCQIVGKLADPEAWGTERVVLYDVTFDGFNLLHFEQKTVLNEDISFAFSDYDLPDLI